MPASCLRASECSSVSSCCAGKPAAINNMIVSMHTGLIGNLIFMGSILTCGYEDSKILIHYTRVTPPVRVNFSTSPGGRFSGLTCSLGTMKSSPDQL